MVHDVFCERKKYYDGAVSILKIRWIVMDIICCYFVECCDGLFDWVLL